MKTLRRPRRDQVRVYILKYTEEWIQGTDTRGVLVKEWGKREKAL
jgi:hypothetical protein